VFPVEGDERVRGDRTPMTWHQSLGLPLDQPVHEAVHPPSLAVPSTGGRPVDGSLLEVRHLGPLLPARTVLVGHLRMPGCGTRRSRRAVEAQPSRCQPPRGSQLLDAVAHSLSLSRCHQLDCIQILVHRHTEPRFVREGCLQQNHLLHSVIVMQVKRPGLGDLTR